MQKKNTCKSNKQLRGELIEWEWIQIGFNSVGNRLGEILVGWDLGWVEIDRVGVDSGENWFRWELIT